MKERMKRVFLFVLITMFMGCDIDDIKDFVSSSFSSRTVYNSISTGQKFKSGDYMYSPNKKYRFLIRRDGDMVLRGSSEGIIWMSGTADKGGKYLAINTKGNLVLRDVNDERVWHTNTGGSYADKLALDDDGGLRLYKGSVVIWSVNDNSTTPNDTLVNISVVNEDSYTAKGDNPVIDIKNYPAGTEISDAVVMAVITIGTPTVTGCFDLWEGKPFADIIPAVLNVTIPANAKLYTYYSIVTNPFGCSTTVKGSKALIVYVGTLRATKR